MSRSVFRCAVGAALGVGSWIILSRLLPLLPVPLRFAVAWLAFTWGPGAVIGARLTRHLPGVDRLIVVLGFGTAAVPIVVDLLGRMDSLPAFPFVAMGLTGAGVALWSSPSQKTEVPTPHPEAWRDMACCAILVVLASGIGTVVFWNRLIPDNGGLLLYGNYDSFDLSFYSVWAAEATHTVPPTASYYSGHALNAAYYPQFVLAMIHRFADVPLLPIYFGYAWPAALSLGALTAFALTRTLATRGAALLAAILIVTAGDFSYLAAWWLPHEGGHWDFLLWPTNFLSPTMEVLYFNTWAQSLPVFFTTLYAVAQALRTQSRGWTLASAWLLATLFQFKVFAFAVLVAALCAAAVLSWRERSTLRRLAVIVAGAVLLALPFLYSVAALNEDRRTRLLIDWFLLPRRMLLKLDLTAAFWDAAGTVSPLPWLRQPVFLLLATVVFFAGGMGIRWFGLPGVWRAVRGESGRDGAAWKVMGWTAVAGVAIPFVLVTDPYVDTLQFYQTGLYILWIFTAIALVKFARAHGPLGAAAIALAVAVSLPSSMHFLGMKWTDARRDPLAGITRGELAIANYLRTCDSRSTVVLHDRPTSPSLLAVVAARRVVLSWAHPYYAIGSGGRLRDVEAFFAAEGGDAGPAFDTLRRYQVTHVVVHDSRDRVHPDVLARLPLILRASGVSLYGVPPL
jgi:hypothetical protein